MSKLIGTAGHVDHGKTTLIKALTGIDADRLPEEKKRGMTIDIGFAFMDLPKIGRVSIVDVPGHEKFVSNMLVGALGIDVALLCVAADESVMPQTREHLQILELLPVDRMVVALTRADLADADAREFAAHEVSELLASTRFKDAPILPVSATTGENIPQLREALLKALSGAAPAPRSEPWYLPIDRVFTVKGHGCVVTGTMARGSVRMGDKAYIQPGNLEVRIRGIHWHSDEVQQSEKGRRTALNVGGVKADDVRRGQTIGAPGAVFETNMLDARVAWVEQPKHGSRVRVSIGADEAMGRMFLSEHDPDLVQLRLESKVAAALEQPVVVRRYSPPDLLCGGKVVVPQARRRRKSDPLKVGQQSQDEQDAILEVLSQHPDGVSTDEICRSLGKTQQALGTAFEKLLKNSRAKGFAGLWFTSQTFAKAWKKFEDALSRMHEKNPSSAQLPRERVLQTAGLSWTGKPLDRILSSMAGEGRIIVHGTSVRSPQFRVQLAPKQRQFLDRVIGELEREAVNTPNPHRISESLNVPLPAVEDVLRVGMQAGEVVQLDEGVYYTRRQLEEIKLRVREIARGKSFSAAMMRDALGTTRKYIIPILEYLDSQRFTTRSGDNRIVNGG